MPLHFMNASRSTVGLASAMSIAARTERGANASAVQGRRSAQCSSRGVWHLRSEIRKIKREDKDEEEAEEERRSGGGEGEGEGEEKERRGGGEKKGMEKKGMEKKGMEKKKKDREKKKKDREKKRRT